MAKKISLKEKVIGKVAERMVSKLGEAPEIAPVTKDLKDSRVALITTAGVLVSGQQLYDIKNGDHSFRIIPDTTPTENLAISHGHYDQSDAEKDINCVFPIDRLHELEKEGFIGSVAKNHFGFMGYIPDTKPLMEESAPQVAQMLKEDNVDVAILSPG